MTGQPVFFIKKSLSAQWYHAPFVYIFFEKSVDIGTIIMYTIIKDNNKRRNNYEKNH